MEMKGYIINRVRLEGYLCVGRRTSDVHFSSLKSRWWLVIVLEYEQAIS